MEEEENKEGFGPGVNNQGYNLMLQASQNPYPGGEKPLTQREYFGDYPLTEELQNWSAGKGGLGKQFNEDIDKGLLDAWNTLPKDTQTGIINSLQHFSKAWEDAGNWDKGDWTTFHPGVQLGTLGVNFIDNVISPIYQAGAHVSANVLERGFGLDRGLADKLTIAAEMATGRPIPGLNTTYRVVNRGINLGRRGVNLINASRLPASQRIINADVIPDFTSSDLTKLSLSEILQKPNIGELARLRELAKRKGWNFEGITSQMDDAYYPQMRLGRRKDKLQPGDRDYTRQLRFGGLTDKGSVMNPLLTSKDLSDELRFLISAQGEGSGFKNLTLLRQFLNQYPTEEIIKLKNFFEDSRGLKNVGQIEHLVAKSSKTARLLEIQRRFPGLTQAEYMERLRKASAGTYDMDWYNKEHFINAAGELVPGLNKGTPDNIRNLWINWDQRGVQLKNVAERVLYGTETNPGPGVLNPNLKDRIIITQEKLERFKDTLVIADPGQSLGPIWLERAGNGRKLGQIGPYLDALFPRPGTSANTVMQVWAKQNNINLTEFRNKILSERVNGIIQYNADGFAEIKVYGTDEVIRIDIPRQEGRARSIAIQQILDLDMANLYAEFKWMRPQGWNRKELNQFLEEIFPTKENPPPPLGDPRYETKHGGWLYKR